MLTLTIALIFTPGDFGMWKHKLSFQTGLISSSKWRVLLKSSSASGNLTLTNGSGISTVNWQKITCCQSICVIKFKITDNKLI